MLMNRAMNIGKTIVCILVVSCFLGTLESASAENAQWIWSPEHGKGQVPQTTCYFRKSFRMHTPEQGIVSIAGDDDYELWVNGTRVATGTNQTEQRSIDVTRRLIRGLNVIAIRVSNSQGKTAGVVADVMIKEDGHPAADLSTDATWATNLHPFPLWQSTRYSDARWTLAQSFGVPNWAAEPVLAQPESGSTTGPQPEVAVSSGAPTPLGTATQQEVAIQTESEEPEETRFRIQPGFAIQEVLPADTTGSLIAMTFNEFGNIIASEEGGSLVLFYDSNDDQIVDSKRDYCDAVKNVQGILALNGDVYVIGEANNLTALYHLKDEDRDGMLEIAGTLMKFEGLIGEHGPHGLTLGTDGLIYLVVGNHAKIKGDIAESSSHKNYYEGDLVKRFEDPGGHAVGVKAPGGMVVRTDLDGSFYEVIAGGLRNSYDLVFNRQGDLFVHDSDMEWDEGLAWHRPTRLLHVLPGSEFGWRSGWAKWPEYYPDSVPSVLDTGSGSPTGMTVYDHHKYPPKFQNRLFLTDWANGRLMTAKLDREGAGYTGELELFLQGDPLTVTDLEVGPDGLLYFCSGGRGTEGGLFRVTYKGTLPKGYDEVGTGIAAVIQQPQPNSAWGRQNIASLQLELGDEWNDQVQGVAIAEENPPHFRTRALDLMRLYGPVPKLSFIMKLTRDSELEVQIKAIEMLSLFDEASVNGRLEELLKEKNPTVRRKACELLAERNAVIALAKIQHCLTSLDRREVWSARRLLEKQAIDTWFEVVLKSDNPRLFNQGALAALIAYPTKERGISICQRAEQLLGDYVEDAEFMNMLRVIQVALHRCDLQATDIGNLATMISDEFPASDHNMNRELIRTLAFFKDSKITDRYMAHLESSIPNTERLHLAMHMTFIEEGWTARQKLQLLSHLEKGLEIDGGEGLRGYVELSTKQFVKNLTEQEQFLVLSMGHLFPNAALATLFQISDSPDRAMLETLMAVDREVAGREGKVIERLRDGIVALLAESGEADMMAYLREVFQNEPERRGAVAFGLAQQPNGENFPLLLEALPILEGKFATTVLTQLKNSTETTDDPHHIRNVLLLGLKLKDKGGHSAIRVLEKWTGEYVAKSELLVEERLTAWQTWFAETYPDLPAAELVNNEEGNWDMKELMDFFSDKDFHGGNRANGATMFKTAKCADCHRHGQSGEAVGPDLTSIAKRFQKKQILESILFPSHIVSDQYASTKVLTVDGKTYVGIMTVGLDDAFIITQSNGEKVSISEADIEEVATSTKSVMPDGLVDALTLEEIADLMTFMGAASEAQTMVAEEPGNIQR